MGIFDYLKEKTDPYLPYGKVALRDLDPVVALKTLGKIVLPPLYAIDPTKPLISEDVKDVISGIPFVGDKEKEYSWEEQAYLSPKAKCLKKGGNWLWASQKCDMTVLAKNECLLSGGDWDPIQKRCDRDEQITEDMRRGCLQNEGDWDWVEGRCDYTERDAERARRACLEGGGNWLWASNSCEERPMKYVSQFTDLGWKAIAMLFVVGLLAIVLIVAAMKAGVKKKK